MLLQALDFLHLFDAYGCRLQLGGSDQWGNITMGVDLIRRVRRQEVWGLTTPLVLKADGTKFGKTESGTVWLDPDRTSPYELYQFFLRSEDAVVGAYLRYFTNLSHEAITELDEATASRPERREAQRELARQVCALVHGADEAIRAERSAAALFGEDLSSLDEQSILDVFAEAPSSVFPRSPARPTGDAPGRPARRHRPRPVEEPGPAHLGAGRCLRQQPTGRRRRPADRAGGPAVRPLPGDPSRQEGLPPGALRLSEVRTRAPATQRGTIGTAPHRVLH